VAIVSCLLPRIPQPAAYHLFADRRGLFAIPNFGDVISNVPFRVIGIWGLIFLLRPNSLERTRHFVELRGTMAVRVRFRWRAPYGFWFVLLSPVPE
jgi:hypothetical protein